MTTSAHKSDRSPEDAPVELPPLVVQTQTVSEKGKFNMSSEPRTGRLLRTLAATKPGGRLLELGAGVGVGSAWLLAGMDAAARLITVEVHERTAIVCRSLLAEDPRVEVVTADAIEWLEGYSGPAFDLVFADTTTAKFERRDLVFRHMANGALFVADDLLPQPKWVATHPARVERFRREILAEPNLFPTLIDWASGLLVAAYRRP